MFVALLIATTLAPLGTEHIRVAFHEQTAFYCEDIPARTAAAGAILGLLTLGNWSAIVVAAQHFVAKRFIRPFAYR